tara:strand:+ start:7542 stop:8162 length:621 start_codon:yes stop_codon:yes gene_type:complete
MKKLISGALDKLMGGEVDPSKRDLIKGAGALGAIAVTPKVARKVIDEVGEPFSKKIDLSKMAAKQITDLPQMKKVLLDENILEEQIFLDEISEDIGREVKSVSELNPKELDKIYDSYFNAPGSAEAEQELLPFLDQVFDEMPIEDYVAKSVPTKEVSEFSFVDNFIDEMKQSGYSNKEISMYLRDVLGRYEGLEVTLPDGSKGVAK